MRRTDRTAARRAQCPMVGQFIGNYRITRQIGRGGMGAVFEAVHRSIGQRVAVKLLHPALSVEPDILNRFFTEARAVNIVSHPGLIRTFDFGQLPDGKAYLIMEYLEGESLAGRLERRGGSLPLREALRITRQVASALRAAHDKGIVHRDLKPENIFLIADPETPSGERAKVLDFGVAKVRDAAFGLDNQTHTGVLLGTPLYMAPEQCQGAEGVDDRADVYSLGVILYQALCGQPPFESEGASSLMRMHMDEEARPLRERKPDLPEPVALLVHAMLCKDPGRRPSMAEVLEQLGRLGVDPQLSGEVDLSAEATPSPLPAAALAVPLTPTLRTPSEAPTVASAVVAPEGGRATSPLAAPRRALAGIGPIVVVGVLLGCAAVWGAHAALRWKRDAAAGAQKWAVSAPAGPVARVLFSLDSEPPGAQVLRAADRTPLGTTPFTAERPPQGTLEVILQLGGFLEQGITLDCQKSCRKRVRLLPEEPRRRRHSRSRTGPAAPEERRPAGPGVPELPD